MKKQWPALVAALLMTAVIGIGMFSIGGNAILNKQGLPVQDSRNSSGVFSDLTSDTSSQTAGLQSLVSQYQQREQQYQDELSAAQQQLDQATNQIEQYQMLLQYLQSRGIIQIDRSGRILVP